MMKLSLMAAFFDTADDEDRYSPIANEIAARWLGPEAGVTHFRSSANFIFSVVAEKNYFLRFSHESERDLPDIEAALDAIEYLAERGIRVARPVAAKSGARVERVETALGAFHAVLFAGLPGEHRNLDDLHEADFKRWGKALGKLHVASLDLDVDRPSWTEQLADIRRLIPAEEEGALSELAYVEERLDGFDGAPDEFGLIHFDFEMDNLLWQDDEIGIVDFDDCAYYPFAADIALALRGLWEDKVALIDFEDERLQTFVAGYREAKALSEEGLRDLPLFMRLSNLVSFARTFCSLAEGPLRQEPVWTAELRQKWPIGLEDDRRDFVESPVRLFV